MSLCADCVLKTNISALSFYGLLDDIYIAISKL
jgi:hypothetical protein